MKIKNKQNTKLMLVWNKFIKRIKFSYFLILFGISFITLNISLASTLFSFTNTTLTSNTVEQDLPEVQYSKVSTNQVAKLQDNQWSIFTNCNDINDLFLDGNYLWAATNGGAIKWDIDNETYEKFTTLNGLINNVVTSITKDGNSNIWFGTESGVCVFNGSTWTTFTTLNGLSFNYVTSLASDKEGNVWIGTRDGVNYYNDHDGKIQSIKNGPTDNDIYKIFCDCQGKVWFISSKMVFFYDGNSWKELELKDNIGRTANNATAIGEDKNGCLWVVFNVTLGNYINQFDKNLKIINQWKNPFYNGRITSISSDNEGNIWFGDQLAGAYIYDGESFTRLIKKDNDRLYVSDVVTDNQGNVWFGTLGRGILNSVYSLQGGNYLYDGSSFENHLITNDGPIDNNITSITQDRKGNIWVSTLDSGISEYDGKNWVSFTPPVIPTFSKNNLVADKSGAIWCTSPNGTFSRYDGSVVSTPSMEPG
jgi:ligand-binding sensor domain-containing protein